MEKIFLTVIGLSLSASVLIVFAIVFRYLFKNAPKWLMEIMWAIVALRLLVPFQVGLSYGIMPEISGKVDSYIESEESGKEAGSVVEHNYEVLDASGLSLESTYNSQLEENNEKSDYLPNVQISNEGEKGFSKNFLLTFLEMVWIIGVFFTVVYALLRYVSIKRKTCYSIRHNSLKDVFVCDDIVTPFILGVVRPNIYLPSGLDDETKRNVLAHERAHIRRFDHIRKQIGFGVVAIHWFNPLVWIAYMLFCKDIELACDEKVITKMSLSEKKSYATSLLLCSTHKKIVLAYPLAFGEVGVKTRVRNILKKKKTALWVIALGVVLCIFAGMTTMTCRVSADTKALPVVNAVKGIKAFENIKLSSDSDSNETIVDVNHYYNVSTTVCKGKTFVETADGIYVVEKESSVFNKVLDKQYSLGTAGENGIFLCELIDDGETPLFDLVYMSADDYSLKVIDKNIDLSNSSGVSFYGGMHMEGRHLYIEGADTYLSYDVRSDSEVIYEGIDKQLVNHTYPYSAVYYAGLNIAYITDRNEYAVGNLHIETADGKKNTIESVGDVMLTPFGALARKNIDKYNDIYLISYDGKAELVYDSSAHDKHFVGYNTFDDNGFYGLQVSGDNEYAIIFCGWDGSFNKIYNFTTTESVFGEKLCMSIIDNWLYFYDYSDHHMKRININDLGVVETIM